MKCRNCNVNVRVELCQGNHGYYMGYYCMNCSQHISLTKSFPTEAEARTEWKNKP